MENIELELASIRKQAAAANEKAMRAKVERSAAESEIDSISEKLKEQFKCDDLSQAITLQNKLNSALEQWVDEANAILEAVK